MENGPAEIDGLPMNSMVNFYSYPIPKLFPHDLALGSPFHQAAGHGPFPSMLGL